MYDVVTGTLPDLLSSGTFVGALCLEIDHPDTPYDDTRAGPSAGTGWYYVVRARNACGTGTYGRVALDGASPCPP